MKKLTPYQLWHYTVRAVIVLFALFCYSFVMTGLGVGIVVGGAFLGGLIWLVIVSEGYL